MKTSFLAAPWEGVNALDAAVLAYNNIAVMRQQIQPESRVHGIILGSQEWTCNVIPAHSGLQCKILRQNESYPQRQFSNPFVSV